MAKEQNLIGTERVTLSVTPQLIVCLKRLVETGFYGKNVAEAAERVLAQVLESRTRANTISLPPENDD